MTELLIRNAETVLTMDDAGSEFSQADILIRDGAIVAVGSGLTSTGTTHDAAGCLIAPGLVNTHHHL